MDAHASFDAPERLLAESEWLARLARSLVATSDDADDLAQDTLAAALAHPPDPERPLRPWLARVAHNLAVRRGVGRTRREDREQRVARGESLASTADVVERVAMQRTVVEAVLALDEPYRATLLLRYWDDLAPREIAERMRVPVETVRTRLKRAVAQLRERLDRRHGGRDEWLSVLLPIALTRAPAVTATATSAGLGSIGALLVSTPMKIALAATALVLAALVVERAVTRDASPQVANAVKAEQPAPIPNLAAAKTIDPAAPGNERTEVDAVSTDTASVPNQERDIVCTVLDAATQAPIAGAHVELRGASSLAATTDTHVLARGETEAHGIAHLIDPRTSDERKEKRAAIDVLESNHAAASVLLPQLVDMQDRQGPVRLAVSLVRGTSVRGRVVAADGRTPVAGASLCPAYRRVLLNKEYTIGSAIEVARSDEHGYFTLDRRLPPLTRGATILYALTDGGVGWTRLGIVEGVDELRDVEVRLRPNAELVVTVTNSQGRPIANAAVGAYPEFEPLGIPYSNPQAWPGAHPRAVALFDTKTDEKGVARFANLPIEVDPVLTVEGTQYEVRVEAPGPLQTTRSVALSALESTALTIVMDVAPTLTLRGTVTAQGVGPLAGALVSGPRRDKWTRSDSLGHYEIEFEVPKSRTFKVTCTEPSHTPRTYDLAIADGETHRALDIEFPSLARIEGRIVDDAGQPLAGFMPQMLGERVGGNAALATGADGTFVFERVDQDPAELSIEAPKDGTRWNGPFEMMVRATDSPLTVQFRRLESARVTLEVELVDATTHQPIAATEAMLYPKIRLQRRGRVCPVEQSLGHLHAAQLSRGAWTLQIETASGARAERTIVVDQDDGEIALHIEIGSPGRIVGRVVFDEVPPEQRPDRLNLLTDPTHEGQWIPVAAQRPEHVTRGYAPLRASEGYAFRLDDVRALDRVVLMLGPSPYYGRAEVSVPAGGEAQVDVHAKLGGELVLVREGELKTATATLTLRCEGESEPREDMLLVDRERLELRSFTVPAGRVRWTIRYWSPASRDQPSVIEGEAQIAPGATVRTPIRF
jgi:RNA polymerase sigma-70 factor (ECF subfamily)